MHKVRSSLTISSNVSCGCGRMASVWRQQNSPYSDILTMTWTIRLFGGVVVDAAFGWFSIPTIRLRMNWEAPRMCTPRFCLTLLSRHERRLDRIALHCGSKPVACCFKAPTFPRAVNDDNDDASCVATLLGRGTNAMTTEGARLAW